MNLKTICLIGIVACTSFIYGGVTVKYRIFPYETIKNITNSINPPEPTKSNYYHIRRSFFNSQEQNADVVMIGDSLTDYAEWSELFPMKEIVNRGVDGDTTIGIADRLDSIYSTKASKAFVMVGFNDFRWGKSVDEVFEQYQYIINDLIKHAMTPYIQSTILAGQRHREINKKINKLNHKLLMHCKRLRLVYIDLNANLSENGLLKPDYTIDDVHLNGAGYKIWADTINQLL